MAEKTLETSAEKLKALRAAMQKRGVDGYLVPRADEFQGEYVPARAERLKWLTGFTGSAGSVAVLPGKAFVLSDGRYTIQLRQQVDAASFETGDIADTSLGKWLGSHAAAGAKIGYDPKTHTPAQIAALERQLVGKNITLVPVEGNLVDAVWDNQPAAPAEKVSIYPESLAGKSAADKRDEVAAMIRAEGGAASVLAAADSIAWLLNIRGNDVPHTPFALSYAVLHENGDLDWFIESAKIGADVRAHLGNHVRIREPGELDQALKDLAAAAVKAAKPVLLDHSRVAVWFKDRLEAEGAKVADVKDPCVALKAIKSAAEQQAITGAHIRDGVAVAHFLKWLDDEAPKGTLSEMDVEDKLQTFRARDKGLRDSSFDTIAGWAGNGAIVHYRVTPQTNLKITPPGLLLVDSGGQYLEGTTDITRTMSVGKPSAEMRENFTRVLKGHIGIATLRFPEGITGKEIDVLARKALWDAGLDYAHGTGHGVGCYLSVHEDGVGISSRANYAFKPGMLVSNEPGYYKENEYGIRIENLILVQDDGKNTSTGKAMMRFETVTLAPIDRRLIVAEMLDDKELGWLNDYHARVYDTLAPLVDADVKDWLKAACAPLDRLGSAFKPGAPKAP